MIEIGFKEMLAGAVFFLGTVAGFGRLLLHQFEKHMDERAQRQRELMQGLEERLENRLSNQDASRDQRLKSLEDLQRQETGRLTQLHTDFNSMAQMMPIRFVQRDDWIRFASQIDHKIDRLGELVTRLSMMQRSQDDAQQR
ncbi:MAG: hypothetical protein Q4G71_10075 [Pseudomonadota bacterium]|nr:hypothetical protein [Pseudomonadota bacterium]